MPKPLHDALARKADKMGLTGERRNAFIYGTMNNIEKNKTAGAVRVAPAAERADAMRAKLDQRAKDRGYSGAVYNNVVDKRVDKILGTKKEKTAAAEPSTKIRDLLNYSPYASSQQDEILRMLETRAARKARAAAREVVREELQEEPPDPPQSLASLMGTGALTGAAFSGISAARSSFSDHLASALAKARGLNPGRAGLLGNLLAGATIGALIGASRKTPAAPLVGHDPMPVGPIEASTDRSVE